MIMTKQHRTMGVIEGLEHYASKIHPKLNDKSQDNNNDGNGTKTPHQDKQNSQS